MRHRMSTVAAALVAFAALIVGAAVATNVVVSRYTSSLASNPTPVAVASARQQIVGAVEGVLVQPVAQSLIDWTTHLA